MMDRTLKLLQPTGNQTNINLQDDNTDLDKKVVIESDIHVA